MNKALIVVGLALLVSMSAALAPCPLQNQLGSLVSARIIVAQQQSLVVLTQGTDVQCYNYSLPYSFATVPSVAVSVHDFQARSTVDLFFSIKPLQSESLAYVPFTIRTHWKYTSWTKIGFSFLAEDRADLEAGYYQVDTGVLGGCEPGKNIQVLLPFRQIGRVNGRISHSLFLHGFQISVQKYDSTTLSPFEVQIADSSTNSSGIIALISVTTVTQVHSLHISYLAWAQTNLNLAVGSYVYELNSANFDISHTPVVNIGRNYARLQGITGFIINYNSQTISFATTWTGSKFIFDFGVSQRLTQYFSFQYLFFIGSECTDCPGYPFTSDSGCVATCPAGSYPTHEKTCIFCGDGYFWDGNQCQKLCPDGQFLNIANNKCECPSGSNWTGSQCLVCTSGQVFQPSSKTCECPPGTRWNGYGCSRADPCINGQEWDVFTFTCKCPVGTAWNGTYCFKPQTCRGGQYLNSKFECVCPDGTYFKDGYCQATGCTGGQIWNGKFCACDTGYNFNGTLCLLCINGQSWDPATKSCVCPKDYIWNGNFCEQYITCSGNRVYNTVYKQCLCPDGNYWTGSECKVKTPCCCGKVWNSTSNQCNCPESFNWDGRTCVLCTDGKRWNDTTKTCDCPPGTQWSNKFCTVIDTCRGGMVWNQNTWACECSSYTVWNGNYCIPNPCKNGQIWDNYEKICRCVGNFVAVNNTCIPPNLACLNGYIFDPVTSTCICPPGSWNNGTRCVPITVCPPGSGQTYNPLNNRCVCKIGLVYLASKGVCGDPSCPAGKRWDGNGCVDISCPPNSYYNGTLCVCPDPRDLCQPWEFFDGTKCVYSQDTCPKGTKWNGTACISTGDCPIGFYLDGATCKPLPQLCIPPTSYTNGKCVGNCPYGTYKSGLNCLPYTQCQNGQIWNTDLIQCQCPQGTGWNGNQCVTCGGGQIWNAYEGCQCPPGYFFRGDQCDQPSRQFCNNIPNAYWSNTDNLCLCDPGFSVVGYQCICKGVPFEHYCDRCAHRPNSEWRFGICQCNPGYTLYGTECIANQNNGDSLVTDCQVGTVFDDQQKKCLPCPAGCIQCSDCYTCITCGPHFTFDVPSKLCMENCGDGKRYTLECDDGNKIPGDGCSDSCKVEMGYTCRGGSPGTPDNCVQLNPTAVTLTQTGQIRYSTKIVLNVRLDYLPQNLTQSTDCSDSCSQVLVATLSGGETSARIKSTYIAGSRYAFSIAIEFDRPYIASFKASIKVNPTLARYFNPVGIQTTLVVDVNPAFLAQATAKGPDTLS